MVELISHFIIQLIQTTGYIGIFVLMFVESALIPIPSEVTMPFSGFLVSQGLFSFILVVLIGTIANLAGSLLLYFIGYKLEESVLLGLIKKYGKFILLSEHEYEKAGKWFKKYGDKVIFISRLLPGIRTVISLPAGMFEMDLKKFAIYTTVGCFIWSALLTYIGMVLGNNWKSLDPYYKKFEFLIVVLIVIAIVVYIEKHIGLRKKLFKK
jgi:membrane protein DedA with SNARE-associated domain